MGPLWPWPYLPLDPALPLGSWLVSGQAAVDHWAEHEWPSLDRAGMAHTSRESRTLRPSHTESRAKRGSFNRWKTNP